MAEHLHIEGRHGGSCDIHDWTEQEIHDRLMARLRASHGKGGTNICRACMARLMAIRDKLRAAGAIGAKE